MWLFHVPGIFPLLLAPPLRRICIRYTNNAIVILLIMTKYDCPHHTEDASKRLNFTNTIQAERSAVVEKQPDKCVPKGRDFDVSDECG